MLTASRDESRRFFLDVWRKMSLETPLGPLESLVAQVIRAHPEHHALLARPQYALEHDSERGNPFLHMGLHIALAEQLQTDRPPGILALFQQLLEQTRDVHSAEHQVMDCLANALAAAARNGIMPDETVYLDSVRRLLP